MEKWIEEILETAREAGKIMLEAARPEEHVISKEGHANFATEYDERIQAFLFEKLSHILPEAHFVGEEDGSEVFMPDYASGFTFVIDPIDGTSNFMKGYRPSVVSIGLLKEGEPYLGIIFNPYTDQMFRAVRGEGAFVNDRRLVTSGEPLGKSLVSMGTAPYYGPEVSRSAFDIGYWYLEHSIDIRRSGSAAWDLCQVALGVTGVFFEPRICLWDYAAGAVIVTEAGGRVTDLFGRDLDYRGWTSVCAASRGVLSGAYLPPEELLDHIPVRTDRKECNR